MSTAAVVVAGRLTRVRDVAEPWGGTTSGKPKFRLVLVNELRRVRLGEWTDLEVASAFADLLHDEFQSYGTDGDSP